MNDSQDIAEFSESLGTAWQVYERGWTTQGESPNPQLAKLGEGIQKLVEHLSNVVRIVGNARICYQQHAIRSPYFRGFFVQKTWDLRSLLEICGNFKATIRDCEALLGQNRDVYRSASSAYGEEWLLVMKPKVDEMCTRMQTHNAKLELVLKPLETKLLSDIQQEFAASQQPSQPLMQPIASPLLQGLVVFNLDQTLATYHQQQPHRLEIAPEIETQIRTQLQESKPDLNSPGNLKLQTMIDGFIEHYDQSTKRFTPGSFIEERQPTAQQYVNLIKAHLTLEYMQQSQELRLAHQSSLWPLFIAELVSMIRQEWQRFSSRGENRIIAPDLNAMKRALRGQREGISSKEDVSKLMSPHYETYSKPVFTIPLPSPQEGVHRRLSISRINDTKLRLVEAVHEDKDSVAPFGEIVMDIDLTSVQLAPIYAVPSSRPRPLEVLLNTQLRQLHPSFCEAKHIFRLQHLLTGYKVYDRYDQAMVKVNFFIAGQKTPLEEHGRVQLWLPQPFETVTKDVEPSKTPIGASKSTLEDSSASVQGSTTSRAAERPKSLRKFIPSFRKGSETTALSSKTPNAGTRTRAESNASIGRAVSSSLRSETSSRAASTGPFELPAATGTSDYLPNAPSGMRQPDINRSNSGNMSERSPVNHPSSPYGYHVPTINQPYDVDDLPEIAQNLTLNPMQHQINRTDTYHERLSPASEPRGWPYSPDSFGPTAPWYGQSHAANHSISHQRSGSLDMSSIYTDTPRAPSTIKPPGLKVQASPSMVSTRSTKSYSSMASSVTTIRTSTGNSSVSSTGVARMHHKPRKPLLVIFLKSRDPSAKLSIVAIQIDSHTSVVRERCDCYSSHSSCRTSCVERKSGDLLAQRWEADEGLASFNVAKLGEHQRKESQNVWPNLKRVSLKFDKMEDRYRFAGSPCSCTVQTTHELSRCNLQSHNGVFGIVKQIGDQLLLNYHNERNSALTRPMVLAPLAESDGVA